MGDCPASKSQQLTHSDLFSAEALHACVLTEHLECRADGADEEVGATESEALELAESFADLGVELANDIVVEGDLFRSAWSADEDD